MNLIEIFSIIIIHWFADFVIQTDRQAKGKSKNWSDLLEHTFVYSIIFGFAFCFFLQPYKYGVFTPSLFFLITFICHTITDYFTSRLNSKLWEKGEVHNFFISVGFDQVLHYIQLFTTYYLLKT
jgi:uncharacterized membrane protein YagU involved in acid resistance